MILGRAVRALDAKIKCAGNVEIGFTERSERTGSRSRWTLIVRARSVMANDGLSPTTIGT
jgi:hypothetical protein